MHHPARPFGNSVATHPPLDSLPAPQGGQAALPQPFARFPWRIWPVLESWAVRRRQRRALMALNDHLLKDIGLTRTDAFNEYQKPFWMA